MDQPIATSITGIPGQALSVVVLTASGRVYLGQMGSEATWTEITPPVDTAWRRGVNDVESE